jgi:hypothetical protein
MPTHGLDSIPPRSKLLLLFGALAVALLVALGGFEFVRSERAVRDGHKPATHSSRWL